MLITKIKLSKKEIIIGVILSLVIGFIYFTPHLLRVAELSKEKLTYLPFTLDNYRDETMVYIPRLREVFEGKWWVKEFDSYEYATAPFLRPPLDPVLTLPFYWLTKSFIHGVIIAEFFFPIIFFWLIFWLAKLLFDKKWFALAAALVFTFFTHFTDYLPPFSLNEFLLFFKKIFPWQIGSANLDLYFTRREVILPTLLLFLLVLIFVFLTLKNKSKIIVICAGLGVGLMFYSYIYYWLGLLIFVSILICLLLLTKNFQSVKRLLIIGGLALVVSLPFWLNFYQLSQLPWYDDLKARVGIEISSQFRFSLWKEYLVWLSLVLFCYWSGVKSNRRLESFFIMALILTTVVALNLQVILGFNVIPEHWLSRFSWLGLGLGWLTVLYYFYQKKQWYSKLITYLLIFLSLSLISHAWQTQLKEFTKTDPRSFTLPQPVEQSFVWLNQQTPTDSVVVTPSLVTNYYLVAYTHNRIFLPRGISTIASNQEIIQRFYQVYRFFRIPLDYFAEIFNLELHRQLAVKNLTTNDYEKLGIFYVYYISYLKHDLDSSFRGWPLKDYDLPENIYQQIVAGYQSHLKSTLSKLTAQYRADYLYLGPWEKKIISPGRLAEISQLSELELVYDFNGVQIYKIKGKI